MANKKISELQSRTPALSDLMLVGDPSSGYSYKCTVTALATIIETDIADGYVTIGTTQTISGAKTFSNNLTLTSVANATTTQTKFLTLNGSNVVNYRTGAEVLSDIGGASAASLSGYVPTSRTLTINGTAFDLSANRSWSVGTVTSVAATAGTGISISGSPITSSGTLTITNTAPDQTVVLTAGTGISISGTYPNFTITNSSPSSGGTVTSVGLSSATSGVTIGSSPITTSGTITLAIATASGTQQGLLSSTDWTTFNNKQNALTLTTTGTSGAATLVGSTLNIPQYQAALTNPVTGTGTTNYIPKFTSSSAIGNSLLSESGGDVTLNGNSTNAQFIITNTNSSSFIMQSYFQAGYFNMTGTGDLIWRMGPSYTERMKLYNSGNLDLPKISLYSDSPFYTGANISSGNNALGIGTTGSTFLGFFTANTERMRLTSGGLLGLGTSSPTFNGTDEGLQISRSSVAAALRISKGANNFDIANDGAGVYQFVRYNDAMYFGTNNLTRMTITSGGEIGFGTITPNSYSSNANNLVVYEAGNAGITIATGTTNEGALYFADGTTGLDVARGVVYYNHTSNFMGFATDGAERMRLDASGRLGIGTSTPDGIIDVTSTVAGTAYSYFQNESTTGVTSVGLAFAQSGTIKSSIQSAVYGNDYMTFNVGSNTERMRLDASGNLGLGISNPAYKFQAVADNSYSTLVIAASSQNGNVTGGLTFGGIYNSDNLNFYSGGSFTTKMVLNTSGNLGLGVSPSAWASGTRAIDIGSGSAIWNPGSSNYTFLMTNTYENGTNFIYKTTAPATSYRQFNGTHAWFYAASGTAGNAISFTQAMTLFSTGNLAVGGTSDGGKRLQVTGAANISQYLLIDNSQTFLGDNGIIGGGSADGNSLLQWYTGKDLYFKESGTARVTFKSGGNVGIGTSSPATTLHVYNNSAAARIESNVNSVPISIYSNQQVSSIGFKAAATANDFSIRVGADISDFVAYTSNTERMRITSGGLVGIGTSAPSVNLQVQSASAPEMRITDGTIGYQMYAQTGSNDMVLGTYTNHNLLFRTNAQARMLLSAAGELLINTTSDAGDYKLQVNGNGLFGNTAGIKELKIQSTDTYVTANLQGGAAGDVPWLVMSGYPNAGNFTIREAGTINALIIEKTTGNATFSGSIKTAAPSGGTAKPIKFGEIVTLGGSNTQGVRVEIDGTVYYLVTGYLP